LKRKSSKHISLRRGAAKDGPGTPLAITHGPAAEVLYEGAECDVDMGKAAGAPKVGAAAKTSGLGYYDQGPEKALIQARLQAALAGASGLLAAQRVCLCLQVGK